MTSIVSRPCSTLSIYKNTLQCLRTCSASTAQVQRKQNQISCEGVSASANNGCNRYPLSKPSTLFKTPSTSNDFTVSSIIARFTTTLRSL